MNLNDRLLEMGVHFNLYPGQLERMESESWVLIVVQRVDCVVIWIAPPEARFSKELNYTTI